MNNNDEKELKHRKQIRKMTKIISRAWELEGAEPFQECTPPKTSLPDCVFDLASIGQNLDNTTTTTTNSTTNVYYYKLGRSGWERFARDLGGLYNRHIVRKTKHCEMAKEHLSTIKELLAKIDASLIQQADTHVPRIKNNNTKNNNMDTNNTTKNSSTTTQKRGKRKADNDGNSHSPKKKSASSSSDTNLVTAAAAVKKKKKKAVKNSTTTTTKKNKKPPSSSRDANVEKNKLRKELDKLSRTHQKAMKALDDFQNDQHECQYPIEDDILVEEEDNDNNNNHQMTTTTTTTIITPTSCPAARIPDIDGFPGFLPHFIPEVLMVWDFLCTFGRALNLNPIQLDDFVAALSFSSSTSSTSSSSNPQQGDVPQQQQQQGDGIIINNNSDPTTSHDEQPQPPVYIAEAHLGLLKLLLQDASSDDWWWSILDTDETGHHGDEDGGDISATADPNMPVIKIDFGALVNFEEDPLITASWLQALAAIRDMNATKEGRKIKQAIKTASAVAANRWVKAYLKKALTGWKASAAAAAAVFAKRAALWLLDRVTEARPELYGRGVATKAVFQQRARVSDQIAIMMERMADSGHVVVIDDLESDDEDSDDDDSDDDEEDNVTDSAVVPEKKDEQDETTMPSKSPIPEKPSPTLVDLLLPPSKPQTPSDLVSSLTWTHLAGASVCRILHFYKRVRNEVDDKLRDTKGLPPMSVGERKLREKLSASRVFSEAASVIDDSSSYCPIDKAALHLSNGGHYLALSPMERLCVLKMLVDAAYDSVRVHQVVDSNYKQRFSALKALDAEERRAKREAREEAAAAEQAARERLAWNAKEKFIEEKRHELHKLNKRTNEYSDSFIDELTEEDIIEFDEDSKAEYEALPTPQSFNKSEVNDMVKKMQEQAAFNTDSVVVVSINAVVDRDAAELKSLEADLKAHEDMDVSALGREGTRRLDRIRKDIEYIKESANEMPQVRESALDMLRDAIEDGTVKSLKSAIRFAKQARLCGTDESSNSTDGMWALDLLRDAMLALKSAERRKRVNEAKKDLVAKMNRCFMRTEPVGRDRFRNSFWHFESDDSARVWVEADYQVGEASGAIKQSNESYVDLLKKESDVNLGPEEKEVDFIDTDVVGDRKVSFLEFSRKEFHRSALTNCLTKRYWGGHATESSLKTLSKNLDDRGKRERQLKLNLLETLEQGGLTSMDQHGEELANVDEDSTQPKPEESEEHEVKGDNHEDSPDEKISTSGDNEVLATAIKSLEDGSVSLKYLDGIVTAMGARVRVREVIEPNKEPVVAHYNVGVVVGWKFQEEQLYPDGDTEAPNNGPTVKSYPVWKVVLDRGGGEVFLHGDELVESISRHLRWKNQDKGYFEHDAAFLSYRNSSGRHCGKAAEAGISATPMFLAKLMVKREQELYIPLKTLSFENNWGGKSGARNTWTFSMKDGCFDFLTAKSGLLSLENAFFELTNGFPDSFPELSRDVKTTLNDPKARFDIELESIEKGVKTLWNSKESRAIFHEIVRACKTTGILALALDLLCRNCWSFVEASKVSVGGRKASREAAVEVGAVLGGRRSTRRMVNYEEYY